MRWVDIKYIPWRIKTLITGVTVWRHPSPLVPAERVRDWSLAWTIVGIHSYQWWWVKKWGNLPCGCTRNPLTRRMVIFSGDCKQHGFSSLHLRTPDPTDPGI